MIALVLLAQVAASSPSSSAGDAPPPVRFELDNGLRVWVQEEHSRPVALVHITYKVGALNEGPGTTGIAHYVEHMVYRATENIRNEDVYGYIDRIGGRYTGGTWPDATRYAETVPAWALESALRVTAERMSRALFDSLEFERERSNVVTEANGFADTDPVDVLRDAVMAASFELHPYRYSSNTWARDNLVLTRSEAYDWYRRHYGPNNAVLVVVGDVEPADVRRLVEKHFAPLPRAPHSGAIHIVEPPQQVEKRVTLHHRVDTTRMEIVYRSPPASHPDYPVLVALDRDLQPALSRVASRSGSSVTITTDDSATAYPYVYRISVSADSGTDMSSVLAAIDGEISRLGAAPTAGVVDVGARRDTASTSTATTTNTAIPPRRSNLTRIAERLASREVFPWDVSARKLDSIRILSARVSREAIAAYRRAWLNPWQRTVGILAPGQDFAAYPANPTPPMTTPPARRLRPESVPARALQPLAPLSIATTRRALENGIVVRAAHVRGSTVTLRVRLDHGHVVDTLVRRFAAGGADSALGEAVASVRAMYATRPRARTDSSLEAEARERVLAGVTPPRVIDASTSAAVSVSVAGPIPETPLLGLVAKHFQSLPRNRVQPTRPYFPTVGIRQERHAVAGATQVEIVAGLPGAQRGHPDRRALELLNYIVGVPSYGGRLGWALTKTGLTYASAAVTTFDSDGGHILFSTTADGLNMEATMQAIGEVVAGVGERGVEEWELREAQAFTLGRTLLYGAREDSGADAIAAALEQSEAADVELLDLPALSRAYLSVTLEDINRVARAYYRPGMLKIVAMGAVPSRESRSAFPAGTFRALFEP